MVGARIRLIRTVRGLKQSHLAHDLGIDQSTLSRIEQDRTDLTFTTLRRLLLILNCTYDDLVVPLRSDSELIRRITRD